MPPLSSDRIVAAARDLADREGLDAVTLRRLATELGVHVTSLYNHVPTLDAIIDGIVALLVSEADLPESPRNWEEWVREFVAAIGAIAEAHPGAFAALERRPVQGERALSSFEVALGAFARAGLSPAESYGAIKVTTYVALTIGLERALATSGDMVVTETELLPAERFPHLLSLPDPDDPEETWAFGVETLVAGLHTQVRRAKRR